jgi:hypothetical protein
MSVRKTRNGTTTSSEQAEADAVLAAHTALTVSQH